MLPRTLKSATIGDQDKQNSEDNNLPVKTSTSTHLNTRGNVVVNSSSVKSASLSGSLSGILGLKENTNCKYRRF